MPAFTEIPAPHKTIIRRIVPSRILEQTAFNVGSPSSTAFRRVPSSSCGGGIIEDAAPIVWPL